MCNDRRKEQGRQLEWRKISARLLKGQKSFKVKCNKEGRAQGNNNLQARERGRSVHLKKGQKSFQVNCNKWRRCTRGQQPTSKCGGVSEGSDLRIGQTGEEGDDVVHEVLIVDDGVLALLHQQLHKLAEVAPELLPVLPALDEGVLATLLQGNTGMINDTKDSDSILDFIYCILLTGDAQVGFFLFSFLYLFPLSRLLSCKNTHTNTCNP